MARYVTKKHGLVISSGEIFFHRDRDGNLKSNYKAVVEVKSFNFDKINFQNMNILTPAQQLIFCELDPTEEDSAWLNDTTIKTLVITSDYITNWLNTNAPGWGFRQRCPWYFATIYFAKRTHAVAFCKHVEEVLKGMKISN